MHGGLHLDARLQALEARHAHVTTTSAANMPTTMPTTGVSDAARATGAGCRVPGISGRGFHGTTASIIQSMCDLVAGNPPA